jgi:hypothetical protein
VADSCEYGDKPMGSDATEFVRVSHSQIMVSCK